MSQARQKAIGNEAAAGTQDIFEVYIEELLFTFKKNKVEEDKLKEAAAAAGGQEGTEKQDDKKKAKKKKGKEG